LLVTHDPLEALVLADRLIVLEDGRIVQDGTPAQVARQPATGYVAKLVGLNLYAGRADGSHVALIGGGTFVIAAQGQHGDVLVAVRPSAVVVSNQRPQPSSARNTWPAKITGLTLLADRVRLDLEGEPSALVDVTPPAVAELSLSRVARFGSQPKQQTLRSTPPLTSRRTEPILAAEETFRLHLGYAARARLAR
jgi:molybdate transport system ATP-binding protein